MYVNLYQYVYVGSKSLDTEMNQKLNEHDNELSNADTDGMHVFIQ